MSDVFINRISKAFPNEAISNDDMEVVLGKIADKFSRAKNIVLRNNGIVKRYYAIDSKGEITHSNAKLTYEAIQGLLDTNFSINDLEVLSCGTSTPDHLLPSHAAMVHGLIGGKSIELNSATGVCCSGMSSLKYGYMSIKSESSKNAICTGSERVSAWMLADKFNKEVQSLKEINEEPILSFKKDFLRWMLSDGAGAILLENTPRGELSLKIEWMEAYSFAHELDTCMYAGGDKLEDGSIKPWSDYKTDEWLKQSIFSIKQDVKLLDAHVLDKGVESMKKALAKNNVNPNEIDYFLPHISSYYFGGKLKSLMEEEGVNIPDSSWFLNLDKVGNVGSASIYIALEELFHSNQLKKGETILLSVPESGRFSYAYTLLTVS